jgi:hypothetical protein
MPYSQSVGATKDPFKPKSMMNDPGMLGRATVRGLVDSWSTSWAWALAEKDTPMTSRTRTTTTRLMKGDFLALGEKRSNGLEI